MPRKPKPAARSIAFAPMPMQLSPAAAKLVADVAAKWELTPPVAQLLQLAGEALTKAEEAERITAVEGMVVNDKKGSVKPHPAALLSRDYRAQASGALQRLLAHLEG